MRRSTPFALVLVAVALAACSPGTSADTAPPSTTASTTSPPPVDGVRKAPCTGLTADQEAGLGLSPGKSISDVGYGAHCMWPVAGYEGNLITVGLPTLDGGGIEVILGNRANHAYHDVVEVEGYPAVFASSVDLRSEGACTLSVGVTDELLVKVDTALPEGPDLADPCPVAERIASAILRNLRTT